MNAKQRMLLHFKPDTNAGVTVHSFMLQFDALITQSVEFDTFVDTHSSNGKWMLVSDYCIDDLNKANSCMVFSLIPHIDDLEKLQDAINTVAPSDIKNSRNGNEEFVKLINSYPIFNIGVVLDRNIRLATKELEYFLIKSSNIRSQIAAWKSSTPEALGNYERLERKMYLFDSKLKKINMKLLRNTEIASTIAAYLSAAVTLRGADLIMWMSDRDNMLTHLKFEEGYPLAFDFAHCLHHVICESNGAKPGELIFAVPEQQGEMWYDPLVRVPDFICGALADFDMCANTTKMKFQPIVRQIFTNGEKNIFLNISIENNSPDIKILRFKHREACNLDTPKVY
ncbi:hypothetical protein [Xanthomonas albilineans]|uniref:hypothetical protein n=1 Tax=Xanthomonas albilineans TaxID=29447 RepID=UPI0005F354C6|nr:hypothetical protein [Xanthomonas albilineans]